MKMKYRVVRDKFAGFEVQYRPLWWPFWRQCCHLGVGAGINTHHRLDAAVRFAELHAVGAVVHSLEIVK